MQPSGGLLVLDDSTLDKSHAKHMGLVHKHQRLQSGRSW